MKTRYLLFSIIFSLIVGTGALAVNGNFSDLPSSHWAYQAVQEGVENGVWEGYSNGTFRPNAPMTRAEMAVVIQRNNEHLENRLNEFSQRFQNLEEQLEDMEEQLQDLEQETQTSTYQNPQYDFSLEFPSTWGEYVAQTQEADWGDIGLGSRIYFGLPAQEDLFSIDIFTHEQWEDFEEEDDFEATYLGENDDYVFAYVLSEDTVNQTMFERRAEVPSFIQTFHLYENDLPGTPGQTYLYHNQDPDFSLELPVFWNDYTAENRQDYWQGVGNVDTVYFSLPDGEDLFSVSIFTPAQWEELEEDDDADLPTFILENQDYVFAYNRAETGENTFMNQRLSEVPSIMQTFITGGGQTPGGISEQDWLIYTEEDELFTFRYPDIYTLEEDNTGIPLRLTFERNDEFGFALEIADRDLQPTLNIGNYANTSPVRSILIDGLQANEFKVSNYCNDDGCWGPVTAYRFYDPDEENIYTLIFYNHFRINDIISSFNFL